MTASFLLLPVIKFATSFHIPVQQISSSMLRLSSTSPTVVPSSPVKIKLLISDTGGGHRASANSLKAAFLSRYPDRVTEESIVIDDIYVDHSPQWSHFSNFPGIYKFAASQPDLVWKNVYEIGEDVDILRQFNDCLTYHICREGWTECLTKMSTEDGDSPDVIISCHPLTNTVPITLLEEAAERSGKGKDKRSPFYTVCTDLNSAHRTWFDERCDGVYVPTEGLRKKALSLMTPSNNGGDKLRKIGLPIREGFWSLSDSQTSREEQRKQALEELELDTGKRLVVVIGGGDGMGKVAAIAENVAEMVDEMGFQLVVICGSNKKLLSDLKTSINHPSVRLLGFVNNVHTLMLGASILITKAGPGTLAEAAATGTPTICTSFLPGQEAGNVDLVVDGGWGCFCSEDDPANIKSTVKTWLTQPQSFFEEMSEKAKADGNPQATLQIVEDIGSRIGI